MNTRFRTATLSHDELRSCLWMKLDELYPGEAGEYGSWCMILDVYDGFVLAKATIGGVRATWKIPYTVDDDGDEVQLGTPVNILEASAENKVPAPLQFRASKVTAGADATALLSELQEKNPLFARLKDSPNAHPVVFDFTTVGRPSQHAGKYKYQLATRGFEAALPSIIGKPIHVTTEYDAHFEADKQAKAIGVFMGAVGIPNEDGTITMRAVGNLWENDFPEEVEYVKKNVASLGASYEIQYLSASADRLSDSLIQINAYEFSGGAILKKTSAAHPESQLLVAKNESDTIFDVMDDETHARLLAYLRGATSITRADKLSYQERDNLKDSDFALIQTVDGKKVRRFPIQDEAHRKNAWARLSQAKGLTEAERSQVANKIISKAKAAGDDWAKDYTKSDGKWVKSTTKEGGASMAKYPGIPSELEAAVDAIIANLQREHAQSVKDAVASAIAEQTDPKSKKNMETSLAQLTAKAEEDKTALTKLEAEKVELTNQVGKLTAENEGLKNEVTAKTTQLNEIEAEQKLIATREELKATFGLTDEQLKEEKRAALVKQYAEGKVPLKATEWVELAAGGTKAPAAAAPVPLMAGTDTTGGGREKAADAKGIQSNFPAAAGPRRVR